MNDMSKKSESSTGTIITLAAGAAAIAAGIHYFWGPNAKKNQKKARGWALKMKAEVVEKLEKLQEVTEPKYQEVIEKVAAIYSKGKDIVPEEVSELAAELKKQWKHIAGQNQKKPSKKVMTKKTLQK